MPYQLSQVDIESITDEEALRGTDRFLPKVEDIPGPMWGMFKSYPNNIYFQIAEAMYVGETPPAGQVTLNPGFTGAGMKRFLNAHILNIQAEYQHRMAGVAYMMSLIVTITPVEGETK